MHKLRPSRDWSARSRSFALFLWVHNPRICRVGSSVLKVLECPVLQAVTLCSLMKVATLLLLCLQCSIATETFLCSINLTSLPRINFFQRIGQIGLLNAPDCFAKDSPSLCRHHTTQNSVEITGICNRQQNFGKAPVVLRYIDGRSKLDGRDPFKKETDVQNHGWLAPRKIYQ